MRCDAALYLLPLLLFTLAYQCQALPDTKGCNRTVRNSVGWIRWNGRMGRCTVRIRAPSRDPQVIELKIRRLQVGFLKDARCEGAYVQFSDGLESFDDKTGRYCGHVTGNATRLFLRKGPDLTIVLDSDDKFAARNPVIFSAQYSVLPARLAAERHHNPTQSSSTDCPLECTIRNDRRTCRLVSPGYPGVYPRGIRCRIALESSAGRFKIGGLPDDLFNLMNYTSQDACQTESCEEHVEHESDLVRRSSKFRRSVEMRIGSQNDQSNKSSVEVANPLPKIQLHTDDVDKDDAPSAQGRRYTETFDRGRRRVDRDEEDEFVIAQTSLGTKHKKCRRKKQKTLKPEITKFETTHNAGNGKESRSSGEALSSYYRDTHYDQGHNHFRHTEERFYNRLNRLLSGQRNLHSGPQGFTKNGNNILHIYEQRHLRKYKHQERVGSPSCVGDYLAVLENVNGRILEISKFCGEGHIPHILSRGKNIIVEFSAEKHGTIMHDGFQLTLQETEVSTSRSVKNCEYVYRSSERSKESIKSQQSWYPPNTLCSYKFLGRTNEKVFIHMKIVKNGVVDEAVGLKRNFSLNYCSGNEIAVYNGAEANESSLMWSYCDVSHQDINNIQVPLTSSGNTLLIQYYSDKGSYDGQEFTYIISYKFVRKPQNSTIRRQVQEDFRKISLKPVNFSALNLNETENCNCDFTDRIGSFKTWFMALVVLGVISFLGAVLTIVALLTKCMKMTTAEKKLLQTPKR